MKLTNVEQLVIREAEEARSRAMQQLEHGDDGIILAQDFKAAAECFDHVAELIALRVREERKAAAKKSPGASP